MQDYVGVGKLIVVETYVEEKGKDGESCEFSSIIQRSHAERFAASSLGHNCIEVGDPTIGSRPPTI